MESFGVDGNLGIDMTRKDIQKRCCGNCLYGQFEMTSHKPPRFKVEEGEIKVGECHFDISPAFEEYKSKLPWAMLTKFNLVQFNHTTHGLEIEDGEKCNCWEAHPESQDKFTYAHIKPFDDIDEDWNPSKI